MNKVGKGVLALLGGLAIAVAVGVSLNTAVAQDKIVVDKNGTSVKLTNVLAESTNTGLITSINGGALSKATIFSMKDLPKGIEGLITEAGASTRDLAKADGTFCFVTFVTYRDKDAGVVDVPMGAECKTFPVGTVLGSVVSFAEDYTKEVTNTYKTKFNVLK